MTLNYWAGGGLTTFTCSRSGSVVLVVLLVSLRANMSVALSRKGSSNFLRKKPYLVMGHPFTNAKANNHSGLVSLYKVIESVCYVKSTDHYSYQNCPCGRCPRQGVSAEASMILVGCMYRTGLGKLKCSCRVYNQHQVASQSPLQRRSFRNASFRSK